MKHTYLVIFERTPNNFSAYVPDLPGCVATGQTPTEVEANIRSAMAFHLEGMARHGEAIPEPTAWAAPVEVR